MEVKLNADSFLFSRKDQKITWEKENIKEMMKFIKSIINEYNI